jgi:hypothetical protein
MVMLPKERLDYLASRLMPTKVAPRPPAPSRPVQAPPDPSRGIQSYRFTSRAIQRYRFTCSLGCPAGETDGARRVQVCVAGLTLGRFADNGDRCARFLPRSRDASLPAALLRQLHGTTIKARPPAPPSLDIRRPHHPPLSQRYQTPIGSVRSQESRAAARGPR